MDDQWDWDDVRAFLAAHEAGSLGAAARELGVSQSTMSRRLAALEDALGAQLFDRTREGLLPRPLAAELLDHAREAERAMLALGRAAEGHDKAIDGRVRVAIPEGIAATIGTEHYPRLRAAHPALTLDFVTGFEIADLPRREADLALRFVKPTQGDLVFKRVARMPMVVIGDRDYVASRRCAGEGPEAFDWVSLGESLAEFPEARWYDAHVGAPPVLSANSYLVQFEAARRGIGVALMARSSLRRADNLVEVETGLPLPPALDVWVVTHRALRKIPRIDAVWCWLEEAARDLEGPESQPRSSIHDA